MQVNWNLTNNKNQSNINLQNYDVESQIPTQKALRVLNKLVSQ